MMQARSPSVALQGLERLDVPLATGCSISVTPASIICGRKRRAVLPSQAWLTSTVSVALALQAARDLRHVRDVLLGAAGADFHLEDAVALLCSSRSWASSRSLLTSPLARVQASGRLWMRLPPSSW